EETEVPNEDSALHPENIFKVGYFRSSYNSSGINSVLYNIGVPTLNDIFLPEGHDSYYVVPDWEQSLASCTEAIKKLDEYSKSEAAKYSVVTVALHNPERTVSD